MSFAYDKWGRSRARLHRLLTHETNDPFKSHLALTGDSLGVGFVVVFDR